MVGAWLKVNAAAVCLLVVAAGAGTAAVIVPGSDDDDGGGGGGGDAFCETAREVDTDPTSQLPTLTFIANAQSAGQLDTLIAEAPNTETADNLTLLQQAAEGQPVDQTQGQAAVDEVEETLNSECDLDLTASTTTTEPSTTTTTEPSSTTTQGTTSTTTSTTTTTTTTTTTSAPPPT